MLPKYYKGLTLNDFQKEVLYIKPTKDKRHKKWQKERQTYGFDARTTWNLDLIMLYDIYARLNMYKDITNIDLEHHKIECYDNKIRTQLECIDEILKTICAISKLNDNFADSELTTKRIDKTTHVYHLLADVSGYLWW